MPSAPNPSDAASISPFASTKARNWPSSVKPLIARSAISAALRDAASVTGTLSMMAFSPSGIVTAPARKATALLDMPVASLNVRLRSLPISGKPEVAVIWRRATAGRLAEAPIMASISG